LPTTEPLNAKLKSREKVEKYTAVITGYLIKHEEKLSK
jgi:pyridoxal/pyridoxine/pyridoxamine kinase